MLLTKKLNSLQCALIIGLLTACSGPTDIKLSEMNDPENAKKLLETLSAQDRAALALYMVTHTLSNDLDYKVTVKQAIEAQKADEAREANEKARKADAANMIK